MMTSTDPEREAEESGQLSLVRGDALWRLQRMLGIIPKTGLGVFRRAIMVAAITWLPVAVWAYLRGRALGGVPEPLLAHFGIHVRLLLAVPLMIFAEALGHSILPRVVPYFLTSGVLPPSEEGRFRSILSGMLKLRDNTLPWVFIIAIVVAITLSSPDSFSAHEMDWAQEGVNRGLGFGGKWFIYVGRPVFLALLLGWLWRLILVGILLRKISRLKLSLVASHPDCSGGLGFIELMPAMFSPIVFSLSALMASNWSHRIVYHGAKLLDLKVEMIAFMVILIVVFLGPYFVFFGPLRKAKRAAELEYGALVGAHGRMVRQKWIEGLDVVDEKGLLGAPEMGPVADHISMFQAVERMRAIPIGKRAVMSVVIPAAIPLLVVISLQIPIKDVLLGLVKAIA
jgi:hypothetical protein